MSRTIPHDPARSRMSPGLHSLAFGLPHLCRLTNDIPAGHTSGHDYIQRTPSCRRHPSETAHNEKELDARNLGSHAMGAGHPSLSRSGRASATPARGSATSPTSLAARPGELVTIDAKDRMRSTETGRSCHLSRVRGVTAFSSLAAFGIPVYYVFGNLGVLCPTEVMSYGTIGPALHRRCVLPDQRKPRTPLLTTCSAIPSREARRRDRGTLVRPLRRPNARATNSAGPCGRSISGQASTGA